MSQEKTKAISAEAVRIALRATYPNLPLDWAKIAKVAVDALDEENLLLNPMAARKCLAAQLRADAEERAPGGKGSPNDCDVADALIGWANHIEKYGFN